MAAIPVSSFRFTDSDKRRLGRLVQWEKEKGPTRFGYHAINSTMILRALIERECKRLDDEEARVAEQVAKSKQDAQKHFALTEKPKKKGKK